MCTIGNVIEDSEFPSPQSIEYESTQVDCESLATLIVNSGLEGDALSQLLKFFESASLNSRSGLGVTVTFFTWEFWQPFLSNTVNVTLKVCSWVVQPKYSTEWEGLSSSDVTPSWKIHSYLKPPAPETCGVNVISSPAQTLFLLNVKSTTGIAFTIIVTSWLSIWVTTELLSLTLITFTPQVSGAGG